MRRLVTSLASGLRCSAAFAFLEAHRGQELLLIASSREAADDLIRNYCKRHSVAFGIHRFTLPALAAETALERLARDGISLLSGIGIEALIARATHTCRTKNEIPWFDPVAITPGFFRSLASTIRELRMNAVGPEQLRQSHAGNAARDLAALSTEFDRSLRDAHVTDIAGIYQAATSTSSRYHRMPLLLLDLAADSRCARDFLTSLASQAPEILATAHSRHQRTVSGLEAILQCRAEALSSPSNQALDRVRPCIFSASPPEAGGADDSVDFRSATDESREAVEIARSLSMLAAKGVTFDQTAVLLRNPDLYQPLIEEAFARAGIPAHFTLGVRKPHPTGRAFLALLACAAENLSASRFSEYLSIGQVPAATDAATADTPWTPIQGELFPEPPAQTDSQSVEPETTVRAPYRWEKLLVDAAVIGGRDRWQRRLDGLDQEFSKQMDEAGDDEPRRLRIERQRTQLKELRRFALPLIDDLARLPRGGTWQEWLDSLERLASRALRHPEAVLSVLAELRPMSAIGPIHIDEVREVLTHRLTFLRVETNERRYGKVFVGAIAEAAGMSFDTVFVPGLGEGIFPQRILEDPLLLDGARTTIEPLLLIQDTRFDEERFLLHAAVAAARRRLYVSYPRMTLTGERSRGPSFYALEVFRAIYGRVPALQELQRTAAEASHLQAGWPAPREAEDAIDDAEYDLAIIHRLTRATPDQRLGAARYLLSANANLARSLRARAHRWRSKWTESDGLGDPSATVLGSLEQYRLSSRAYSATGLQQFAACPYRFFLYSIVRLEPRIGSLAMERMDPLTRGSLFHSIQFRLLTLLRDEGIAAFSGIHHDRVLEVADELVDRTAAEFRDLLAPAITRVWNDEVEDIRWDIRGWLREMESTAVADGWLPRWFELGFGIRAGNESDPESSPSEVVLPDGTRLRGAIDLVEERNGTIRITDHKTGKPPLATPSITGHGEILQPLLYAQAAETLLQRTAAASRLSYCTDRGGYRVIEIPVGDDAQRELTRILSTVDHAITEGFLPAAPRKGACLYCDYRPVCGPYEEHRLERKNSARLTALDQVRRTP